MAVRVATTQTAPTKTPIKTPLNTSVTVQKQTVQKSSQQQPTTQRSESQAPNERGSGGGGGGGSEQEQPVTQETTDTAKKPNWLFIGIGVVVLGATGFFVAKAAGWNKIAGVTGGMVIGGGAGWAIGHFVAPKKA